MSRKKPAAWALDPTEVVSSTSTNRASSRTSATLPRRLDASGVTIRLKHTPTGISIEGEIPSGHYGKDELRERRDALRAALFADLERRVARHLKIPGR